MPRGEPSFRAIALTRSDTWSRGGLAVERAPKTSDCSLQPITQLATEVLKKVIQAAMGLPSSASLLLLLIVGQLLASTSLAEALRHGDAHPEWTNKYLGALSYGRGIENRRVAKRDEQSEKAGRAGAVSVDEERKPKRFDSILNEKRPPHNAESPTIEPAPTSSPIESPYFYRETIIKKTKAPTSGPTTIVTESPTPDPTRKRPTPSPTVADAVDDSLHLELAISVWTSQREDGLSSNVSEALEASVIDALLQTLCVPEWDVAANSSTCVLNLSNETSRQLEEVGNFNGTEGPVIWTDSPTVQRRSQSNEIDLSWTEFEVAFTVLSVGDSYMQKAEEDGLTLSEALKAKALKYLSVDVQARVHNVIESGELNTLLQQRWSSDVLVSQVGQESTTFNTTTTETAVYTRNDWPFIRIAGIALMSFTIVSYFVLYRLSVHRRRRLTKDLAVSKGTVDSEACSLSVASKTLSIPVGSPLLPSPETIQVVTPLTKGSFDANDDGITFDLPSAFQNLAETYRDCCA